MEPWKTGPSNTMTLNSKTVITAMQLQHLQEKEQNQPVRLHNASGLMSYAGT